MSPTRLLRLLAILMLVVTPVRVMASASTMGTHEVAIAIDLGHCDGADKSQKGQPSQHRHCSVTAPGVPLSAGALTDPFHAPALAAFWLTAIAVVGIPGDAATPPPKA
jgi:hypothetical protein